MFVDDFAFMKVAIFPSAYLPSLGGVEELTRHLAATLQTFGHKVQIFTERWPRRLARSEIIDGITVSRFPFRVPCGRLRPRVSYFLSTLSIRRGILRELRQFNPDIIHVQCVSSNGFYARIASKSLGIPLVVSLQGEITMDAQGIYLKPGEASNRLIKVLRSADSITACSSHTLAEAEKFFADRTGDILLGPKCVVPNGVQLEAFRPGKELELRPKIIFALGRHVFQKGFDILITAMANVDVDYELFLAGDGPERAALESLAHRIGVANRVKFLGKVSPASVSKTMREARLFVLPSRHEPFGIVNLEAMASCTPIVACDVGGVAELLRGGKCGRLVAPNCDRAMSDAINESIRSLPDVHATKAAYLRSKEYCWEEITKRYISIYRQVAEG